MPVGGVVPKNWGGAVADEKGRVERIPYELCLLVSLRDALRRREVFVDAARKWRDPEDDLPKDFDVTRELHYEALRQPLDPTVFIRDLQSRMGRALEKLENAMLGDTAGGVKITQRKGVSWIKVPKLERQVEPVNLGKLKDEVLRRRGTLDLLEVFKEADCLTGCTEEFNSIPSRQNLNHETLRRRLLMCLFGLGTNMGIKAIANTQKLPLPAGRQLAYARSFHLSQEAPRREKYSHDLPGHVRAASEIEQDGQCIVTGPDARCVPGL